MKLLGVVFLLEICRSYLLSRGQVGTMVAVYLPTDYQVEFVDL